MMKDEESPGQDLPSGAVSGAVAPDATQTATPSTLVWPHNVSFLRTALRDLIDQVESLDDYTLTRDAEPYKAVACWDDALRFAKETLQRTEPQP